MNAYVWFGCAVLFVFGVLQGASHLINEYDRVIARRVKERLRKTACITLYYYLVKAGDDWEVLFRIKNGALAQSFAEDVVRSYLGSYENLRDSIAKVVVKGDKVISISYLEDGMIRRINNISKCRTAYVG